MKKAPWKSMENPVAWYPKKAPVIFDIYVPYIYVS